MNFSNVLSVTAPIIISSVKYSKRRLCWQSSVTVRPLYITDFILEVLTTNNERCQEVLACLQGAFHLKHPKTLVAINFSEPAQKCLGSLGVDYVTADQQPWCYGTSLSNTVS
jgi:hypothetical protein